MNDFFILNGNIVSEKELLKLDVNKQVILVDDEFLLGVEPQEITQELIQKYFNIFNKRYFNSSLEDIEILVDEIQMAGYFQSYKKSQKIIISNKKMSEYVLCNVLLHEMIHAWQFYNNLSSDEHTGSFLIKKKQLDSKGWNIYMAD